MPAFIWVGVGVLVAFVYGKVSSFFQGGPQAAQARMMSWVRMHTPLSHCSCRLWFGSTALGFLHCHAEHGTCIWHNSRRTLEAIRYYGWQLAGEGRLGSLLPI